MSISRVKHELGLLSWDRSAMSGYNGQRPAFGDLFRCRLTEWSTIVSMLHRRVSPRAVTITKQSTTGWLTPSDDLTQWDANSFLFFFSLLCFCRCKQKTECCVPKVGMAAGSGKENIQRSHTNCWGRGRQCGRSHNNLWWRRTCVYEKQQRIRTERERERHKEYIYIHRNATVTT